MRNNTMNAKSSDSLPNLVATLVLSAAVMGATSLVPVVAADKKEENKVSKDLAKPLKAAQDALQRGGIVKVGFLTEPDHGVRGVRQ